MKTLEAHLHICSTGPCQVAALTEERDQLKRDMEALSKDLVAASAQLWRQSIAHASLTAELDKLKAAKEFVPESFTAMQASARRMAATVIANGRPRVDWTKPADPCAIAAANSSAAPEQPTKAPFGPYLDKDNM